MPRHLPSPATHPAAPGDWTIVHRHDPAMELHLALMVDAADDALRDRRALDRLPRPAAPAPARRRRWGRPG